MLFSKTDKSVVGKDGFLQSCICIGAEQLFIQRETMLFGETGKSRNEEHFFLQRNDASGKQRIENANTMLFSKTDKSVVGKNFFLQRDIGSRSEQICVQCSSMPFREAGKAPLIFAQEQTYQGSVIGY